MPGLPVGAIVALASDTVPTGWLECNGENGTPDLRGVFLCGCAGIEDAGKREAFHSSPEWYNGHAAQLERNIVSVELDHIPTRSWDVSEMKPRKCNMVKSPGNKAIEMPVYGGDAETRPVNIALLWIMKVDQVVSIPAGCVIPFQPWEKRIGPAKPSWLLCNGKRRGQEKYKGLYSVIGDRYLPPKISPDDLYFWVPDLRGMFIRGAGTGEQLDDTHGDPDLNVRVLFNGDVPKKLGLPQAVNTYQAYATDVAASQWKVPVQIYPETLGQNRIVAVNNLSGHTNVEDGAYSSKQTWTGFGLETRPRNIAFPHYISTAAMEETMLPIGTIIASVSQGPCDYPEWALCDGGGTTPQLTHVYIRALDDRQLDSCAEPVWADPDHPRAAGSFQFSSIGCPQEWQKLKAVQRDASGWKVSVELLPELSVKPTTAGDIQTATAGVAAKIPGNHRTNSVAGHAHEICEWNGDTRRFEVKGKYSDLGLKYPTVPKTVLVNFFVKVS